MSHAAVADHVVEQRLEVRVERVDELELLVQVAAVHLDVAGLVDHLGRRVELGVDVGHGLHDLRGADERALLAVHELAELPRRQVPAHVAALLRSSILSHHGEPNERDDFVRHRRAGCRDRRRATSRCGPRRSTAGACPCRRGGAAGRAHRRSRSRRPSCRGCRGPTRARRFRSRGSSPSRLLVAPQRTSPAYDYRMMQRSPLKIVVTAALSSGAVEDAADGARG